MSERVGNSRARKDAILRQMGVDVWLPRTGPRTGPSETGIGVPPTGSSLGPSPVTQTAVTQAAATQAPVTKAPVPEARATESRPPQSQAAAEPIAPFSVSCLSKGAVLMLVELPRSKAARRFALDVLAASSGQFGGDTAQLAFDWPQPGVDNHSESAQIALGAFVAKQMSDQTPALVLVGREVADRLARVPDDCILMAPLAELMVDGAKKRALWAELEGRR